MKEKLEPLTESYFFILLCLLQEPMHGYGIMNEAMRLSGGRVIIGSGTMYGAVNNMLKRGWIAETEQSGFADKKRRMYHLTEKGKEILSDEIERLNELTECARQILDTCKGESI